MKKGRYVIATRGSRLSVSQTEQAVMMLEAKNPGASYEITTITTKGDTDARPLFAIDQKGIFEKEVDRAVADGSADFAVHSLKDVPSAVPDGLVLACVPEREDPSDVLVTPDGRTLGQMRPGSVIGTSSLRRAVQITRARPDVTVRPIRGNVETRIGRVRTAERGAGSGEDADKAVDGVVLARAGISRLGIDVRYAVLPHDAFVPSPGQGALAITAKAGDRDTIEMLRGIEHADSRAEADAERALSDVVGSGCRFPVGARARCSGGSTAIRAEAFSIDGSRSVTVEMACDDVPAAEVGRRAGMKMISGGGGELGLKWREGLAEWNRR